MVDLQAMVDYMAAFAADAPLARSDYGPARRRRPPAHGDTVELAAAPSTLEACRSLAMTAPGDRAGHAVRIRLGGKSRGTAPVAQRAH